MTHTVADDITSSAAAVWQCVSWAWCYLLLSVWRGLLKPLTVKVLLYGYWHQMADDRHGNSPPR